MALPKLLHSRPWAVAHMDAAVARMDAAVAHMDAAVAHMDAAVAHMDAVVAHMDTADRIERLKFCRVFFSLWFLLVESGSCYA